jgi:hypothetical protein
MRINFSSFQYNTSLGSLFDPISFEFEKNYFKEWRFSLEYRSPDYNWIFPTITDKAEFVFNDCEIW